jgi:hypothetical protein
MFKNLALVLFGIIMAVLMARDSSGIRPIPAPVRDDEPRRCTRRLPHSGQRLKHLLLSGGRYD